MLFSEAMPFSSTQLHCFLIFDQLSVKCCLGVNLIHINIRLYIGKIYSCHFSILITNKINVVKAKIIKTPIIIFT